MRKFICLSLLMVLLPTLSCATAQAQQKPNWAKNYGIDKEKYPLDKYIIGFGISSGRDSDALEIAQRIFNWICL